MMNNDNLVHAHDCKCVEWKPVIAGALVAIGLAFLLNIFSVAIGLTAFSTSSDGVETLVFGGLLGTAIGIVASMFAAGWIAGYLGQRNCNRRHLGALYGFLAWVLALIITIFLASHVQQYLSFYGHSLSGTTDVIVVNAAPAAAPVAAKAVATKAAGKMAVAATETPAKALAISAYIIFTLFFLSAFAASLGGHCGMRSCCKEKSC
jgi:hypothetical protein